MTIHTSQTPPSLQAARASHRRSGGADRGLLGALLIPLVLLMAALNPRQTMELSEAESID